MLTVRPPDLIRERKEVTAIVENVECQNIESEVSSNVNEEKTSQVEGTDCESSVNSVYDTSNEVSLDNAPNVNDNSSVYATDEINSNIIEVTKVDTSVVTTSDESPNNNSH